MSQSRWRCSHERHRNYVTFAETAPRRCTAPSTNASSMPRPTRWQGYRSDGNEYDRLSPNFTRDELPARGCGFDDVDLKLIVALQKLRGHHSRTHPRK